MEKRITDILTGINCPVIVTDSEDKVYFKNPSGKRQLPLPRHGSSVIPYINPQGINILDDSTHTVSILTLSGGPDIHRRALVFSIRTDGSDYKVWFFDFSLQMLRPDSARSFVRGAAKAALPFINDVVSGRIRPEDIPDQEWSPPLKKLSNHLFECLRKMYFTSGDSCCVDAIVKYLRDNSVIMLCKLGCPGDCHYIVESDKTRYMDFCAYTMIYLRLLMLMLSRTGRDSFIIDFRKDSSVLRTSFTFGAQLRDPSSRTGGFREFYGVFADNQFNIALIEALFNDKPDYKFFFEINSNNPRNVKLCYEIPVYHLDREIHQMPEILDNRIFCDFKDFIDDTMSGLK